LLGFSYSLSRSFVLSTVDPCSVSSVTVTKRRGLGRGKKIPLKTKISPEKKMGNSTSKYLPLTGTKPPGDTDLTPTHPSIGVSKKIKRPPLGDFSIIARKHMSKRMCHGHSGPAIQVGGCAFWTRPDLTHRSRHSWESQKTRNPKKNLKV